MNPIKNPNASVAWQGTSLGVLLVWGLGMLGVAIPAAPAAALAGAVGVGMVYAGRRGLRSIPLRIWRGEKYDEEEAAKAKPAPAKRRRTRSTSRGRR